MFKRKIHVKGQLTNSELVLMNILWDVQRPITGPEILTYVKASPDGPAFARSSYHSMVNDLLKKGYIISIGGCGHGKNQARQFIPAISRNEYYAVQISSGRRYTPRDIPDIVCSLVSFSNISSTEKDEILHLIEVLLQENSEQEDTNLE